MTEEIPRAIAEALGHMPGCLLDIVQAYAVPTGLDILEDVIAAFSGDDIDWNGGLTAACCGHGSPAD